MIIFVQDYKCVMIKSRVLIVLCLLLSSLQLSAKVDFKTIVDNYSPDTKNGLIYIDKKDFTLTLFSADGEVILEYPIACGRNYGQKQRRGDYRTPEGMFHISQIQNSSSWGHDFKDGKGFIKHAYGHWFLRLETPGHRGIGIHGTHDPNSIGTRATEGCIRLENSNLEELHSKVVVGTTVIIGPDDSALK